MYRRALSVLAVFAVALLGCRVGSQTGKANGDKVSEAEARWAKEIAEHFLDAFAAGNADAMKAVSTTALAKEITGPSIEGGPAVFTITAQEMSPDVTQSSIKGVVHFQGAGTKRSFTLLMEKEEGWWKVSSFTQGAPQ